MDPTVIGVAGPRKLTHHQRGQAWATLHTLLTPHTRLHVGCACGLDAIAWGLAYKTWNVQHHIAEGRAPWQLQQRTKRLVTALAAEGGTLHAWPNKPCPPQLTRSRWKGSGTWGAIREAVALGVPVELHPLGDLGEQPSWLNAATEATQTALTL